MPLSCCPALSGRALCARDWREVRAELLGLPSLGWIHPSPVALGALLVAGAGAFALRRPQLHRGLALVVEKGHVVKARLFTKGTRRLRVTGSREGFPLPGVELEEAGGKKQGS